MADQLVFEVTVNEEVLPCADAILKFPGETESVAAPAVCVTVTVFDVIPVAEMVTIAVRAMDNGLASAVMVTALLSFPDAIFAVSHDWLETTFQVVLDVTWNVAELPATEAISRADGETERVGAIPDWVT